MRILSLNCRNWNRDKSSDSAHFWKQRALSMNWMIDELEPDVICFQEMIFPMTRYIPSGYRKVGFSVSHHIYVKKGLKTSGWKFRVFWQCCMVEDIKVFCVHGRWEPKGVSRLCGDIISEVEGKAVAMGDFNVGLTQLYTRGMPDSARVKLGMAQQDTFQNFDRPESRGEIDHAFLWGITPKSFRVITYGYGAGRISDHYPILLEI